MPPVSIDFAWSGMPPIDVMIEDNIERDKISIGSVTDDYDDLSYWLSKSPEERIEGVEFLRRQFYSYGEAEQEFRRFLEVTEREES